MIVMTLLLALTLLADPQSAPDPHTVLIEAESLADRGGWKLDTQFIDAMGSPYLLAHGLGRPVDDATGTATFSHGGTYRVFVRTFDWVARWDAEPSPGRFAVSVNGERLPVTLGTAGRDWGWHEAGTVAIEPGEATIGLHDLTGFDGRCDAIVFTTGSEPPPNDSQILAGWRRDLLGLPTETPTRRADDGEPYDLVVVGGGYAGVAAALSAARMGCSVALVQNRPVLGGNGSSEVRVWAMGLIRRGQYPRIGEIVEEFCDRATKSPGTFEEFGDAKKEAIVRAEPKIDLLLNHHAFEVEVEGDEIVALTALDTRTSATVRLEGRLFADCTGHGTIGAAAGADFEMTPAGRMGMSNMWRWAEDAAADDSKTAFPDCPWALDLAMADFPYPRDHHGQWFWESGFDKDPLGGAEAIRDWNLRAVFGAFDAMKNGDGAADHENAFLTWVAYVGGPRESRRLMGDVVLTQDDIVSKREFEDGCVPSTWSIDLHYPKEQYADAYPENPFISVAVHDRRIDRKFGYPVPYRCLYSRNIGNLFMAGRNISVTHEALGTTRVMKTCGMMGEVVGKAASIAVAHDCRPRDVYERYWPEMTELLQLPGVARRETPTGEITIENALAAAGPHGPMPGRNPARLAGVVVDDAAAKLEGRWTEGHGLKGFVGWGYRYAATDSGATATFTLTAADSGKHDVRLLWGAHENRGTAVPVTVRTNDQSLSATVDMTTKPQQFDGFDSLGRVDLDAGDTVTVTVGTADAGGTVHIDAVQLVPLAAE